MSRAYWAQWDASDLDDWQGKVSCCDDEDEEKEDGEESDSEERYYCEYCKDSNCLQCYPYE